MNYGKKSLFVKYEMSLLKFVISNIKRHQYIILLLLSFGRKCVLWSLIDRVLRPQNSN